MSDKVETLVFPETGTRTNDFLLGSMLNGGGMGGYNNWFVWLFLLMIGRNGFGFGDGGNTEATKDLLMSAIQGNNSALQSLASQFNCSISQVQTALNAISTQINNIGAQVGMTGQQVINAVQSGNMEIAQQIANCCCNVREAITRQGYESQLATCNQTNALTSALNQQSSEIRRSTDTGFLSVLTELRNMQTNALQDKLTAKEAENATLKAQINNEHQTQAIGQMFAQQMAQTADLRAEIEKVKCGLPPTTVVPNPQVAGIPICAAYQLGLYGGYPNGNLFL